MILDFVLSLHYLGNIIIHVVMYPDNSSTYGCQFQLLINVPSGSKKQLVLCLISSLGQWFTIWAYQKHWKSVITMI